LGRRPAAHSAAKDDLREPPVGRRPGGRCLVGNPRRVPLGNRPNVAAECNRSCGSRARHRAFESHRGAVAGGRAVGRRARRGLPASACPSAAGGRCPAARGGAEALRRDWRPGRHDLFRRAARGRGPSRTIADCRRGRRAMSIKSDKWIRRMAASHGIIEPFEAGQVREANGHRIVSYGTSSYGYDIRCSDEFKIFTNINSTIVDPKKFDEGSFVDFKGEVCIIPPNSFALARTVEYFRIPRNVLVACLGKSTYARCGIIVNVTPLEPEWEGHVTLEFSNTTPLPAKIYANEGVAQVIFFESDEVCETSYKDRGGKYQGQKGVTLPKM